MKIPNLNLVIINSEDWNILHQIAIIEQNAFQEDALSVFNLSLMAKLDAVLAIVENETVIAEAVLLKKDQSIGLIFGFAVTECQRQKGIGGNLLNMLIVHAKQIGLTSLILTVNPENTNAMHLYQNKFGFIVKSKISSHPVKNEQRWVLEKIIA